MYALYWVWKLCNQIKCCTVAQNRARHYFYLAVFCIDGWWGGNHTCYLILMSDLILASDTICIKIIEVNRFQVFLKGLSTVISNNNTGCLKTAHPSPMCVRATFVKKYQVHLMLHICKLQPLIMPLNWGVQIILIQFVLALWRKHFLVLFYCYCTCHLSCNFNDEVQHHRKHYQSGWSIMVWQNNFWYFWCRESTLLASV